MLANEDPAVQRRKLRVELRRLRQDAGMTQLEVVQAMDWSFSKLFRIESGDVVVSSSDLRVLLELYGVQDTLRVDALADMARTARKDGWCDLREVHSSAFLTYLGRESSARTIRSYEPTLVPGLLQTEEYAWAVLTGRYQSSPRDVERRWQVRQRRQELHDREDPPAMDFLIDEAVVRRRVGGPGVMRRQLERLRQWSAELHITLRIVPFAAGLPAANEGPFVLLDFDEPYEDSLLYREHVTGDVVSHDPEETSAVIEAFFALEALALSGRESVALLDELIQEMDEARAPAA